jgi:hypothetical protein
MVSNYTSYCSKLIREYDGEGFKSISDMVLPPSSRKPEKVRFFGKIDL